MGHIIIANVCWPRTSARYKLTHTPIGDSRQIHWYVRVYVRRKRMRMGGGGVEGFSFSSEQLPLSHSLGVCVFNALSGISCVGFYYNTHIIVCVQCNRIGFNFGFACLVTLSPSPSSSLFLRLMLLLPFNSTIRLWLCVHLYTNFFVDYVGRVL